MIGRRRGLREVTYSCSTDNGSFRTFGESPSSPSNTNRLPLSGSTMYSSCPLPLIPPPTSGSTPSLNVHLILPPSRSTACMAPSIVEMSTKGSRSWSTSGAAAACWYVCRAGPGPCSRGLEGSETTAGYGSGAGEADRSKRHGKANKIRCASRIGRYIFRSGATCVRVLADKRSAHGHHARFRVRGEGETGYIERLAAVYRYVDISSQRLQNKVESIRFPFSSPRNQGSGNKAR